MIINDKRALAYVVTIDEIKPIEGYDRVEYGNVIKTYAWFSEEDWGNSKVAVAVMFSAPEGSSDYKYYMHTAQGNF